MLGWLGWSTSGTPLFRQCHAIKPLHITIHCFYIERLGNVYKKTGRSILYMCLYRHLQQENISLKYKCRIVKG